MKLMIINMIMIILFPPVLVFLPYVQRPKEGLHLFVIIILYSHFMFLKINFPSLLMEFMHLFSLYRVHKNRIMQLESENYEILQKVKYSL